MKNIINRIKNDKVLFFLSILIIGVFLVLVIRITYSYLAAFINEARENVTIGSDTTDKLEFFEGNPIDLNVTSTTLPEGGGNYAQSTTYRAEFTANSTNNTAEDSYYVYFNVTANTLGYIQEGNPEVILTVFQDDTEITNIEGLTYGTYNGVNGFDVTTATGMFTVASDYAITSNSSTDATVQNWTFTLTYLNQNYDQSGNYGNNMSVEFIMSKEEKIVTFADTCRQTNSNTLACHVATQYTIDGANGLYYHTSSLANSAGDNSYRYAGGDYQIVESYKDQYNSIYGEIIKYYCNDIENNDNCNYDGDAQFYYTLTYDNANTKYTHAQALSKAISDGYITNNIINNYVCFGSTASPCPNDNLYRIIGVFDGEVKLIKADYSTYNQLGTNGTYKRLYVDSSTSYSNTTHYKGHNTNSIGAYYWDNVENKNEWSWNNTNLNILNLNQNYLNSLDNEWSSMITTHTWKTGGINKFSSIGTPQTTYNYEVGANSSSTTYNAKIGLMYVSDYGFAASNTYWSTNLYEYNSATSNNWLYLGLNEWTITNDNDFGFFIAYFGRVISNVVYWNSYAIRPVFYLNSDVEYSGGTGTESDPFTLVV